jgi:lycopene beta-cyclase
MRSPLVDVTVVGTGVSSLLLARALLTFGACGHVTLVGPGRPLKPHLLSYWADHPTPFDAFERASWSELEVHAVGRALRAPLSRYRYRCIDARAWAASEVEALLSTGSATLVEESVDAIDDVLPRPAVRLGHRRLTSDWVFTATPAEGAAPDAWQRFEGWELELERPVLDTRAATLLDSRTWADGDFRFIYALPLAPDRLFLEHLSRESCDHAAALTEYLGQVLRLDGWRIVHREGGATPLFREGLARAESRVVHIGVAAGLAQAGKGAAVMRMWRALPLSLGWPSLYRVDDRFFLDRLATAPARIEQLLAELFSTGDGDSVLARLDAQASAAEQARVALAMPGWVCRALLGEVTVTSASAAR